MKPAQSVDLQGAVPALRQTANNPHPMTADGTNSYLLGRESVAVIDPGPNDPAHLDALAALTEGRPVFAVLVTHSHVDHSAGARALAERLRAPLLGFGAHEAGRSSTMQALAEQGLGGGEGADPGFAPDRALAHGAAIESPCGAFRILALHTPGHTSNHLCFALETPRDAGGWISRALFSGDHVMGWATSIVSPPDGDMGAYMSSLALLSERSDPIFLPGHGDAIADPAARLAELTAHRRGREASVLKTLEQGPATAKALAAAIYTDVDPMLLPLAERNVLAHLIDLWEQGRCAPKDGAIKVDARFVLR